MDKLIEITNEEAANILEEYLSKIKFARGIGTNRVGKKFFKNIKIQGCTITSTNEALNMYDVLRASLRYLHFQARIVQIHVKMKHKAIHILADNFGIN